MRPPAYSIRLPLPDRANVAEMARLYGAKSAHAFMIEMASSLCSGNQDRVSAFVGRLMTAMAQQLTLDFEAQAKREVQRASKHPGRIKGGKRRARST
jgi:hypothetical protein